MQNNSLTLAAVFAATILRWLLDPLLGNNVPYATFFAAVAYAAWIGGGRTGLLATVTGMLVAAYLFVSPRFSVAPGQLSDLIGMVMFVLVSLIITGFGEAMRRAQRDAEERSERLRTTFASIGDAVITTDVTANITGLNAVAESLTGWTAAQAIGQPLSAVFRIVNETTRRDADNPAYRALREGIVVGLANHTILIARDGTERAIEDSAAPIRRSDGEMTGCVLIFRDVSERRNAERVVSDSRAYAENIVDTVREPLLVLDANLRVVTVNRAFCKTFQVSAVETVGQLLYELGDGQWNIATLRKLISEILLQKKQFDDYRVEQDFPKIGHRVMLLNARRIFREGCHKEHILLAIEDVTDRSQAAGVESQLASVVTSSYDAIISKSLDGIIQSWNAAAERLFGYQSDQAIGRHISFLFPPDRLGEEDQIIAKLRAGDRVEHFDTVRIRSDGQPVHVSLTVSPIRDSAGQVIGASKIVRDISERIQAQEKLRHNEVRQRHQSQAFSAAISGVALEQSLDPLIQIAVGELKEARAAFYLLNFDGTQLQPITAVDEMPPCYIDQVDGTATKEQTLAGGLSSVLRQPIITPDVNDEPHWKPWLHLAQEYQFRGCWSFPISTSAGKPVGILALYFREPRDATPHDLEVVSSIVQAADIIVSQNFGAVERQRAQKIMDAEKQVLEQIAAGHSLQEVLTTLVVRTEALSKDGMICSVLLADRSGQRLLNGAAPNLPEEYNRAIHGIEIGPNVGSCGTAAFEQQTVYAIDVMNDPRWEKFKDLAAHHGLGACFSHPIFNSRRELLGTFAIYYKQAHQPTTHDREIFSRAAQLAGIVIERSRAEEKLREYAAEMSEADRRKNEFLAMLAHELRNPLAPIRNAVQVLKLRDEQDEILASTTGMMERQVGQMVRLVDDLLDVSRISRGKIELKRERAELASIVHHAVEAARPVMEGMDHQWTVAMPEHPIHLHADPARLAQVVGNLLNNAAKFTDRGGVISLTVDVEPEWAVVRVKDNGIGIAADQLPRIFEMFMQIDTSLERSTSGLGIGLTLVKNLVEMHGGTAEVHSDGIGHGSEFIVRLPVDSVAPAIQVSPTSSSETSLKSRRVLVVDDNRDSAISLAMLLKLCGHDTYTAHDGLQAFEETVRLAPDVVLMDIGLPKLNGYESCRRIRELPQGGQIIVIALTGWGQEQDKQRSSDAGFDGHLVKPVDLVEVTTLLNNLDPARTRQ